MEKLRSLYTCPFCGADNVHPAEQTSYTCIACGQLVSVHEPKKLTLCPLCGVENGISEDASSYTCVACGQSVSLHENRKVTACPICGAENTLPEDKSSYTCIACQSEVAIDEPAQSVNCPYCGITNSVPADSSFYICAGCTMRVSIDEDKASTLLARAYSLQLSRQFAQAEKIYLELDEKDDPTLCFNILLCRYGAEIRTSESGKEYPFPFSSNLSPVREQPEYATILKLSGTDEKAARHLAILDELDTLLAMRRKVKDSEQGKYDVFICVKQADASGHYTPDSALALEIYDHLTSKGLRVFNTRLTPIPVGVPYAPIINAALINSKVMIVIGSSPMNIESMFVQDEWSRFLWLKQNEKEPRTLLCVTSGGMTGAQLHRDLQSTAILNGDSTAMWDQLDSALRPLFPGKFPFPVTKKGDDPSPEAEKESKKGGKFLKVLLILAIIAVLAATLLFVSKTTNILSSILHPAGQTQAVSTPVPTEQPPQVVFTLQNITVYTGPGEDYDPLRQLQPGESFPYLGTKFGWHKIVYDGAHVGYVDGQLTDLQYVTDGDASAPEK